MEGLSKDQALQALQKVVLRKMMCKQEQLICELIDQNKVPIEFVEPELKIILLRMLKTSLKHGNCMKGNNFEKKIDLIMGDIL